MVRGKVAWLYRDACEKPFGDNLRLGGWAWLQTSLFTVPLHAAALPLLAALTPLPFTEEEQPSPQSKNSSGRGHFDVGSSYTEFILSFCLGHKKMVVRFGLEDVARQCHSVSSVVPEKCVCHDFYLSIINCVEQYSFFSQRGCCLRASLFKRHSRT